MAKGHKYKVEFEKGKLDSSLKNDKDYDYYDCFYGIESPYWGVIEHDHGGGPCNHAEIPRIAREALKSWIKYNWHWSERTDYILNKKEVQKKVKHKPVNRSTVDFRCDYPEVLDREGFFRMIDELKGAKVDKVGGRWR